MEIFDKIKRRARDVIRAAKGEPWGDLVRPVEFKRVEAEVETYRITGHSGPIRGSDSMKERILRIEIEDAAARLGRALLEKDLLKLEVAEDHDPLSLQLARERDAFPGYAVALEVKVVKPEQMEGVQR